MGFYRRRLLFARQRCSDGRAVSTSFQCPEQEPSQRPSSFFPGARLFLHLYIFRRGREENGDKSGGNGKMTGVPSSIAC